MKSKSIFSSCILAVLISFNANAGGNLDHHNDPLQKTFISNPKSLRDPSFQKALLEQPFWQKFIETNGTWNVIFNENSALPLRAYGKPISSPGFDIKSTAENFIGNQLRDLNLPVKDFQFLSISTNNKYHYVNYKQYFQGLEVLFSSVQIKMMHDFRINQFGLECHRNINVSISPAIDAFAAANFARNQVDGIQQIVVNPDLKILPIPQGRSYEYHLVYDVMVENLDHDGIPGKYYTLVDATSGEILYRANKVNHIANTDVTVKGTLHLTNPYDPATFEPMKNLRVVVNGNIFFTDDNGYLGLTNTTATTATMSLQGKWVRARTNSITPTWTVNLNPGVNDVDIDQVNTDIKQRTTYDAINTVHDYMKTKYPLFTGLDNPMTANIDVPGTCNAFYNGSSVNFFDIGGGCNATSLIQDVAFHEYGHAINDRFYQGIGFSFDNGAMNEGYADLWAMGITTLPVLGTGFSSTSSMGYIRRYDINKKVFPTHLIGEVHADGEIIAGCFWDTGLNLGNLQQMMDLFKETFYAGITGPNGDEGNIFAMVLLETLTQDDNDGDLTNGTPNYCPITAAFALHGIDIGANLPCNPLAFFTYTPNVICSGTTVTYHDASSFTGNLDWSFPGGTPSTSTDPNPVITYNTDGVFDAILTVDNGVGTDTHTETAAITVLPGVGQYALPFSEGFENITFPGSEWQLVNNGGNLWEQNTLAAKTGVNSVYVDNFNGNVAGTDDVFYTPTYDLSAISNASMTFELAFAQTNSASADRLKVLASTNCGQLWNIRYNKAGSTLATAGVVTTPFIPSQGDWAIQSVSINSVTFNNKPNVQFRFEYTHDAGNNIFIDDINITGTIGVNEINAEDIAFNVYPNPVSSGATINFTLNERGSIKLDVIDVLGREVEKVAEDELDAGEYQFDVPAGLASGMYHVRIIVDGTVLSKKIFISE